MLAKMINSGAIASQRYIKRFLNIRDGCLSREIMYVVSMGLLHYFYFLWSYTFIINRMGKYVYHKDKKVNGKSRQADDKGNRQSGNKI